MFLLSWWRDCGRPCQVDSSMIRVMMGKRSNTWSGAEKSAALSALFDRQNKCVLFKKSSWLHTWPGWVVNLNMLPVTLGLCGYVHLSFDLSTHICFVKHLQCPSCFTRNSAGAGHKIEIKYREREKLQDTVLWDSRFIMCQAKSINLMEEATKDTRCLLIVPASPHPFCSSQNRPSLLFSDFYVLVRTIWCHSRVWNRNYSILLPSFL